MRKIRIVETGEIFDSIQECADEIDGNYRCILRVLHGERSSYRGLTFEYYRNPTKVLDTVTGKLYSTPKEAIEDLKIEPSYAYKMLRGERLGYKKNTLRYIYI